jgi:DNA-binding transcriptional LysR family regulator
MECSAVMDAAGSSLEPLPSRELAAFVAAVEGGRLGTASDSLALTQSAITKRIQSLERRLGTTLLERSHHGVRPTAAGRALYPEAKEALAALARAARTVTHERTAAENCLRLAASHTIGEFLLPRWLAAFRMTAPALSSQVAVTNSADVLAAVREGDVEIGFLPDPDPGTGLDSIPIGKDELVVAVRAGHRWAKKSSVAPSELASETFFTREEGSGTRSLALEAARRLGIELRPQLAVSSTEALRRTVLGGGFTIISSLAVEEEWGPDVLRALPIHGADLSRAFYAIRCEHSTPLRMARQFWSWLARTSSERGVPGEAKRI